MIRLDERGKQCPLPVIEAKRALEAAAPGEAVEVIVDNEIAVQNLKKLADHKGLSFASEKKSSREYAAVITAGEGIKEKAHRRQMLYRKKSLKSAIRTDAGREWWL